MPGSGYFGPGDPRNRDLIPLSTLETIRNYVEHGWHPGDFVLACLVNDFMEAVHRADVGNLRALPAIACYLYNEVPAPAWHSIENVKTWLALHAERRAECQRVAGQGEAQ